MIGSILAIIQKGLEFAVAKEGNKHLDMLKKTASLKKEYYEELEKPDHERSQLALDRCMRDIEILADAFSKLPVAK